jgi:hypothetical protein
MAWRFTGWTASIIFDGADCEPFALAKAAMKA